MRKKIVGSSWKMHINSFEQAQSLGRGIVERVGDLEEVDLFILPSFPLIETIRNIFEGSQIKFGAQNISVDEKGAQTGEVPINLIKELGGTYIELGHAERRAQYNETNEMTAIKVGLCEKYDMTPIVCIGETQEDIDLNRSELMLKTQILWALQNVSHGFRKRIILAYEPVWAIGQPVSAQADYIEKTHRLIRKLVEESFGKELADEIRIIYGGSVSPQTAQELSSIKDVDGLFVGRFGLTEEGFESIVHNFINLN